MLVPSFVQISSWASELLGEHDFHILKFSKGHNSIKTEGGVTVIVLCILSVNVLYLYQVL